jgi:hypothetical protein
MNTENKVRKEGKPRGKKPPSRYNASKEEKKVAKKLFPSLQDDRIQSDTSAK